MDEATLPQAGLGRTSLWRQARTWPNVLSLLRLALCPVFAYLLFVGHDVAAIATLAVAGLTDYLDGWLARTLNQHTELGRLLDPAADRLYMATALFGLTWRGVIDWRLTAFLVGRDVLVTIVVAFARARGIRPPDVTFTGKAATLCLLYAWPIILCANVIQRDGGWIHALGWSFAWWGVWLYAWSGVGYLIGLAKALHAQRSPTRAASAPS